MQFSAIVWKCSAIKYIKVYFIALWGRILHKCNKFDKNLTKHVLAANLFPSFHQVEARLEYCNYDFVLQYKTDSTIYLNILWRAWKRIILYLFFFWFSNKKTALKCIFVSERVSKMKGGGGGGSGQITYIQPVS